MQFRKIYNLKNDFYFIVFSLYLCLFIILFLGLPPQIRAVFLCCKTYKKKAKINLYTKLFLLIFVVSK